MVPQLICCQLSTLPWCPITKHRHGGYSLLRQLCHLAVSTIVSPRCSDNCVTSLLRQLCHLAAPTIVSHKSAAHPAADMPLTLLPSGSGALKLQSGYPARIKQLRSNCCDKVHTSQNPLGETPLTKTNHKSAHHKHSIQSSERQGHLLISVTLCCMQPT